MNQLINCIEVIKDISQIIFYLAVPTLTCIGLNSWKKELIGKNEYEIAKQALSKAYSIKHQIWIVQNAIVYPSEWAKRKPKENETESQKRAAESYFAYQKRLQSIENKINKIRPTMIEVEAVFGEEAKIKLDKLIAITDQLRAAITVYHKALYRGEPINTKYNKYFNIMEGISGSEEDLEDDNGFKSELDAVMQEIKEYFMPKLGHKPPVL